MRKPTDISDLVSEWRYIADMAEDMGVEKRTIYRFVSEAKLSTKHWDALINAAKAKKLRVNYDWIARQVIGGGNA